LRYGGGNEVKYEKNLSGKASRHKTEPCISRIQTIRRISTDRRDAYVAYFSPG